MELYIIRHAQSENNALMRDQTDRVYDPDLTEVGFKQAEMMAKYLSETTNVEEYVMHKYGSEKRQSIIPHRITHLYCSAMHRSLKTARPLSEALGLTPEVWLEIHEHGGIYLEEDAVVTGYGGMTRSEILNEFTDYILPETVTEEGWWDPTNGKEDFSLCQARAIRVAEALRERSKRKDSRDDAVALVSHGGFIDCLIKAMLNNMPAPGYFHWHYNTAISRFDLLPDSAVLVRYINRVSHLPPALVT